MTDGFEHRLNYYLLFKGNLNFKEKEETKIQKVEILLDKHGYDQILYDICERRIKYSTHEHFIPGNHIGFYYWAKWEYKWHPSQEYIECSKLNFPRCNNVDGEHYDFCSLLQKKNPTDPFKIYVLNESNENINY